MFQLSYMQRLHMPLSTCENIWLQRLVLHQCPHIAFPSCFALMEKKILAMGKETMDLHVLPNFAYVTTMVTSFDLWIFKCRVDTFALVINFVNESWTPMHVIVDYYEMHDTTRLSMARQLQVLLESLI